jgi:hypothetical protein
VTRLLVPLVLLTAALLTGVSSTAAWSASTGNVNLLVGTKLLDEQRDDPPCVALDVTWGLHGWPLLLNAYVSGSWMKGETAFGDDLTEAWYETGIGLTRMWSVRSFHPSLGAGIAQVSRRTHILPGGESGEHRYGDEGTRLWIAVGGSWRLGSGLNLGVATRFSEIGHTDRSLGGTHLGFTLGWGWPGHPPQ